MYTLQHGWHCGTAETHTSPLPYHTAPRRHVDDDNDDDTAAPRQVDACGYDLRFGVHSGFMDTMKTIASENAGVTNAAALTCVPARQHPLFIDMMRAAAAATEPTETMARRQHLALVSRRDEERFMRRVREGETPCAQGDQCEGHLIARHLYTPKKASECGFTCPVFVVPGSGATFNDLCVLCLRKQTALQFYALKRSPNNDHTGAIVQPYRNMVQCSGEYDISACLCPGHHRFEGISDPYVRFQRHQYVYAHNDDDEPILRHRSTMLYFRNAPPGQQIADSDERGVINPGGGYESAAIYGAQCGRRVMPYHWTCLDDVTSALQHGSFFVQERATMPIVHVLCKALPQRCLYRNLKEICAAYCTNAVYFWQWLKKVLLTSLGGYYMHCEPTPPQIRAALLRGFFETTRPQFVRWILDHGHIVFYALKELLTVLIRLDPALHAVLQCTCDWDEFEWTSRNAMRCARRALHRNANMHCSNIFDGLDAFLTRKQGSKSVALYKLPRMSFIAFMHHVAMLVRQRRYEAWLRSEPPEDACLAAEFACPPDAASIIRDVTTNKGRLPCVPEETWLRICGAKPTTTLKWSIIRQQYDTNAESPGRSAARLESLSSAQFAVVNYYITCSFNLSAIRETHMPAHWLQAQRHHADKCSKVSYVCPSCRQFKGFVVRDTNDRNYCAHGFHKVMVADDGALLCARRQVRPPRQCGRRANGQPSRSANVLFSQFARMRRRRDEHRRCSETHLVPVQLCGNVVESYSKLYALCWQCGRSCMFDFLNFHAGGFMCAVCSTSLIQCNPFACFFCGTVSRQRVQWCSVQLVDDSTHMLCRRHAIATITSQTGRKWVAADLRGAIVAASATRPPRTRKRSRASYPSLKSPRALPPG